jgi:predicted MFS family arabinose efflux permease
MTAAPPRGASRQSFGRRTFGSLAVRNFRLFIAGQLLSTTGTWMQGVAAPLLVLHLTHSGTALGIDTALQFLPILLLGAWGGVIADRFDNRRVQIATQVGYATVALALWAIVTTGVVTVWMVYALSFASGVVTAVDMPTRQSFYVEMVGQDSLTNAMSLNTATFTGSRILGSALAGVLIARGGYAIPFLVNGVSYLAVVAALLAMRVEDLHPRQRASRRAGQVREAVRYVWRTPELRLPMLTMLVVFLFAFNFVVYVPLLVTRAFHERSETLGALLSLWGVGSLVGALVMASRSSRPNPRRLAALAVALGALSVLLGASPAPWFAAIVVVPLGAVFISFAITGNATLQLTSSETMRGRVMALYSVVFLGSTPLGGPVAGWIGEHLGAPFGLAASGAIAVAAGVASIARLSGRRAGLARRRSPVPEEPNPHQT